MRGRYRSAVFGVLLVGFVTPLAAQERGAPVQLTLSEAVARGLRYSEEVEAARARYRN
jgi:hypothetical protein